MIVSSPTKFSQSLKVLNEMAKAVKYFGDTKYWKQVKEASAACNRGDYDKTMVILGSLPTEQQLLEDLVSRLKGKSVYGTLKKIKEGSIESGPQFLKGLFSLGAHISIEIEHGNKEYSILYPVVYEKLGEILYNE